VQLFSVFPQPPEPVDQARHSRVVEAFEFGDRTVVELPQRDQPIRRNPARVEELESALSVHLSEASPAPSFPKPRQAVAAWHRVRKLALERDGYGRRFERDRLAP
jgi:hypothetical protein